MRFLIALCLVALIALLAFYLPKNKKETANPFKTIELTVHEGTNMAATISPDKQTIAIDLQGRLWLLPTEGGEAKPITDKFGDARQPSWSPDGNRLTFQGYWEGNWHIYTIQKDGSDLQQLTNGVHDYREPHWSPDEQKIAFASDKGGTYDIWTIDLATKVLAQVTKWEGNQYAPAWNKSGNRLAFISDNPDKKGIYYHSFLKNKTTLIGKAEGELTGVSWRPDGTSVTFVQHDFDESNLKQYWLDMPEPMAITKNGEADVFPFRTSWLSNNEFIYTANGQIIRESAQVDSKQTIPFSATFKLKRPTYAKKKRNFDTGKDAIIKGITHPNIAPNGVDFTFIGLNNVWIQHADGSLTQVTKDAAAKITPVWSPDGKTVAYVADKEGNWAIYAYRVGEQTTQKIGDLNGAPAGIAFSPDGNSIAYSLSFGPRLGRLGVMDITTGATRTVSKAIPSSVGSPSWSADGKIIATTTLEPYSKLYREGVNRLLFILLMGRIVGLGKA
ncbi:MAG: TolB family protein [Saprospiraceae bacterium]